MDKHKTIKGKRKSRWREALPMILWILAYMSPLFWLWNKTGYPDALGVHIGGHGEAGLLESWWYSYLLLRRHQMWDVIAFIYMWLAVVVCVAWLVWAVMKDRAYAKGKANSAENAGVA